MSQTKSTSLNIIVVGAGISGLCTAIASALAGHHVLVLEGAKELAEIGAGFQVTPNGAKVLQQLGLYDALEPKAAEPTFLQVRRYSDGKILSQTHGFDVEMRRKYGAPFWDLHRVDVQAALATRAKELGVEMRFDARVVDIDFETPSLNLEHGEEMHADLLVGADGLWSKCRESYLRSMGKSDSPLPTGDLAYRIILPVEDLKDDDLRDWIANPSCQFWIGGESHVVAYSLRKGAMLNLVMVVPDNLPETVARQPGSLDEMRQLFANWDPVLNRFLDHVKSVDKWKLMHRVELDSWVSEKSNFVFVGDACHPMLPYLAQGANQSMEDGAVLGYILAAVGSKDQLPSALQLYEKIRKERGEAVVRETFAQRDDFHMCDGAEQQARDELMLSKLGKDIDCKFPSRWQCPEVQPWLYGFDAKQATEEALRRWPLQS